MKKILFGLVCVMLLIIITGCATSKEEKEKRNRYFAQAKENAVDYVEQKYGFTPDDIGTAKCTFDNSDNFSSSCNEMVIVNVQYKDKWFKVYIDGSIQTNKGYDNYQYDDISSDLIKLLSSEYGTPNNFKFYYGYDDTGIIDTYYNGTNLEEIFNNKDLRAFIGYINKDNFKSLQSKLSNSKYDLFSKLYIVNYNSSRSYKKIKDNDLGILTGYGYGYFDDIFYENEEYLRDITVLYYDDVKFYDFDK